MEVDWNVFFPPGTRVIALPGWRNPRLYVRAESYWWRWWGSDFYPAYRLRARLYRRMVRARAAGGFFRSRTAGGADHYSLARHLENFLPGAGVLAVLVGTEGPTCKITLQLASKERIVGYAKYAPEGRAVARLAREHLMLSSIPAFAGPRSLGYVRLDEGAMLVTGALDGRRVKASLPPNRQVKGFLEHLSGDSGIEVWEHPWFRAVREDASRDMDFDRCMEVLSDRRWPVAIQHGDFAPWNLRVHRSGGLTAFDWEYGSMEGFPHLDLAYYVLQTAALIHRWSPERAARCAADCLLQAYGDRLRAVEARTLVRLAAYNAYLESARDGQSEHDVLQRWRRRVWDGKTG